MSARRAPNSGIRRSAHQLDVLAQIELIRLEGQAAVPGEEPDQRDLLLRAEHLALAIEHACLMDRRSHGDLQHHAGDARTDGAGSPGTSTFDRRTARHNRAERAICVLLV